MCVSDIDFGVQRIVSSDTGAGETFDDSGVRAHVIKIADDFDIPPLEHANQILSTIPPKCYSAAKPL
jgi:hypothetical protein